MTIMFAVELSFFIIINHCLCPFLSGQEMGKQSSTKDLLTCGVSSV